MNAIEDILGMVATDAQETALEATLNSTTTVPGVSPTLQFDLELVRLPDGSLTWVE